MTGAVPSGRLTTTTSLVSALLAASCCILPIILIAMGVAGAGLMMTMMRYEWITLPLGALGLGGAYAQYFRTRRRCHTAGCRFAGQRAVRTILALATVVVAALLLRLFPSSTAWLMEQL